MFDGLRPGAQWTGPSRGSPARWKVSDAEVVVAALREAEHRPVSRPFDSRKLQRTGKRRGATPSVRNPCRAHPSSERFNPGPGYAGSADRGPGHAYRSR